jgi:pimeloyl-ACP methyl ester carboxylesterase
MHPGSGPSDRDNDWFFPPIRRHLLEAGIAVCSFDKRGVGGSEGSWLEAGIEEQADDLLAALGVFATECPGLPIGLFGHSQGGWVVVEAASRSLPVAFVIPSSGGGASPARQERYSLANKVTAGQETTEALATYDAVVEVIRERPTLGAGVARLEAEGVPYRDLPGLDFMFEDEAIWRLCAEIFAYDPAPALARITAPVLGLLGAADKVNPPEESLAAFRVAVREDLLEVEVFPEGDHRLQHGDPPRFVDGYFDRIASFMREAALAH